MTVELAAILATALLESDSPILTEQDRRRLEYHASALGLPEILNMKTRGMTERYLSRLIDEALSYKKSHQ